MKVFVGAIPLGALYGRMPAESSNAGLEVLVTDLHHWLRRPERNQAASLFTLESSLPLPGKHPSRREYQKSLLLPPSVP